MTGVNACGHRNHIHCLLAASPDRSLFVRTHFYVIASGDFIVRFAIAALTQRLAHKIHELLFQFGQVDAILWALWSCDTRLDGRKIQIQHRGVVALPGLRYAKHALCLVIPANRLYLTL